MMRNGRFHTIADAAKLVGVSPSTLRNYERQGLIPKAKRINLNRIRAYTNEDVEAIKQFMADYIYSNT